MLVPENYKQAFRYLDSEHESHVHNGCSDGAQAQCFRTRLEFLAPSVDTEKLQLGLLASTSGHGQKQLRSLCNKKENEWQERPNSQNRDFGSWA